MSTLLATLTMLEGRQNCPACSRGCTVTPRHFPTCDLAAAIATAVKLEALERDMTTLAAVGLGIHVDALESYAERLRALLNTDPLTLLDERAAKARLEHGEGQPTAEQITDAARRMNAPEAEAGA